MILDIVFWCWNKIYKDWKLRVLEEKWGLYSVTPRTIVNYIFCFVRRDGVCGHYDARINIRGESVSINSIIRIDLDNKVTEDSIIYSINHEVLHVAIHSCLINSNTDFIEKVIDGWMLSGQLFESGNKVIVGEKYGI